MDKDNLPWTEKYRPEKIDDISYHDEIKNFIRRVKQTNELPHLLFHGPSGTGKTSTIIAIANELFGMEMKKNRIYIINASDKGGINDVRRIIKWFAKTALECSIDDTIIPPYKIIILEEADMMTREAQNALRVTMEECSGITRFCFICNYVNQINDAIKSRCASFYFPQLNHSSMYARLNYISKKENLNCKDDVYDEIIKISNGDMRQAVCILQNLKFSLSYMNNKCLTIKDVKQQVNHISFDKCLKIIKLCKQYNVEQLNKLSKTIIRKCYSINQIIEQIIDIIIDNEKINDNIKVKVISLGIDTYSKINENSNEYLQILNFLISLNEFLNMQP